MVKANKLFKFVLLFFPLSIVYFVLYSILEPPNFLMEMYLPAFQLVGCASKIQNGLVEIFCQNCRMVLIPDCSGFKEVLFLILVWLFFSRKEVEKLITAIFVLLIANLLRLLLLCPFPVLHNALQVFMALLTVLLAWFVVKERRRDIKGKRRSKSTGRRKRSPRKGRKFPPRSR